MLMVRSAGGWKEENGSGYLNDGVPSRLVLGPCGHQNGLGYRYMAINKVCLAKMSFSRVTVFDINWFSWHERHKP